MSGASFVFLLLGTELPKWFAIVVGLAGGMTGTPDLNVATGTNTDDSAAQLTTNRQSP